MQRYCEDRTGYEPEAENSHKKSGYLSAPLSSKKPYSIRAFTLSSKN